MYYYYGTLTYIPDHPERNQRGNIGLKGHIKLDGLNRYILLGKNSRKHILSSAHGTFSRTDLMLPQTSLNKFKKIEIIPSIFSNQNGMKKEINHKKKMGRNKKTDTWRPSNMLLNDQWINKENKEEIKNNFRKMKRKHRSPKSSRHSESSSIRNFIVIQIHLPQETRKISSKQSNLTPKRTR